MLFGDQFSAATRGVQLCWTQWRPLKDGLAERFRFGRGLVFGGDGRLGSPWLGAASATMTGAAAPYLGS